MEIFLTGDDMRKKSIVALAVLRMVVVAISVIVAAYFVYDATLAAGAEKEATINNVNNLNANNLICAKELLCSNSNCSKILHGNPVRLIKSSCSTCQKNGFRIAKKIRGIFGRM
jgi:ammonia channel protein AmtB